MARLTKRLETLERLDRELVGSTFVPGTVLRRYLAESGVEWSLGVGGLNQPKVFFTGPTVEVVLEAAESYYANANRKRGGR